MILKLNENAAAPAAVELVVAATVVALAEALLPRQIAVRGHTLG